MPLRPPSPGPDLQGSPANRRRRASAQLLIDLHARKAEHDERGHQHHLEETAERLSPSRRKLMRRPTEVLFSDLAHRSEENVRIDSIQQAIDSYFHVSPQRARSRALKMNRRTELLAGSRMEDSQHSADSIGDSMGWSRGAASVSVMSSSTTPRRQRFSRKVRRGTELDSMDFSVHSMTSVSSMDGSRGMATLSSLFAWRSRHSKRPDHKGSQRPNAGVSPVVLQLRLERQRERLASKEAAEKVRRRLRAEAVQQPQSPDASNRGLAGNDGLRNRRPRSYSGHYSFLGSHKYSGSTSALGGQQTSIDREREGHVASRWHTKQAERRMSADISNHGAPLLAILADDAASGGGQSRWIGLSAATLSRHASQKTLSLSASMLTSKSAQSAQSGRGLLSDPASISTPHSKAASVDNASMAAESIGSASRLTGHNHRVKTRLQWILLELKAEEMEEQEYFLEWLEDTWGEHGECYKGKDKDTLLRQEPQDAIAELAERFCEEVLPSWRKLRRRSSNRRPRPRMHFHPLRELDELSKGAQEGHTGMIDLPLSALSRRLRYTYQAEAHVLPPVCVPRVIAVAMLLILGLFPIVLFLHHVFDLGLGLTHQTYQRYPLDVNASS